MIKFLTPSFYRIAINSGKYAIVIVALALAFNFWGVFDLTKIPIPYFLNILYFYLIINVVAATPFHYFERKIKKSSQKLCPKCNKPLDEITEYKCRTCGRLEFKDDDKQSINIE